MMDSPMSFLLLQCTVHKSHVQWRTTLILYSPGGRGSFLEPFLNNLYIYFFLLFIRASIMKLALNFECTRDVKILEFN